MELKYWSALVLLASATSFVCSMQALQTTNTNCTTAGNHTNCASTSSAEQQQRSYETGQQIGSALGEGLAGVMQAHSFAKGLQRYCEAHPGQDWHYYSRTDGHELSSGRCPNDEDRALEAVNIFMSRHKDYKPDPANAKALTDYIAAKKLDPREVKSYERAYKDLKRTHQIFLYSTN